MIRRIFLGVVLITVAVIAAAQGLKSEKGATYLPMALLYVDGKLGAVKQVGPLDPDLQDCVTKLQAVVESMSTDDEMPKNAALIGSCMAVPAELHQATGT